MSMLIARQSSTAPALEQLILDSSLSDLRSAPLFLRFFATVSACERPEESGHNPGSAVEWEVRRTREESN